MPEFTESSMPFQSVSDVLTEGMRLKDLDHTVTQADIVGVEASLVAKKQALL